MIKIKQISLFLLFLLCGLYADAGTPTNPALLWATYYGGKGIDEGYSVATDDSGNIYFAGYTTSITGIATTGAFQTSYGGGFLAKFSSSGERIWATYFGNSDSDHVDFVTTDNVGNLYITGWVSSSSNIATPGAFKTSVGMYGNAFLAKFTNCGKRLWATYYGGSGGDYPYGMALDNLGNIYVSGYTTDTSGIATPGSFQSSFSGGDDGFIAKFSNSGKLLWATYVGDSSTTQRGAVTTDNAGNVYLGGTTASTSGIATSGAFQVSFSSEDSTFLSNMYIEKFSSSGSRIWGTYFGTHGTDISEGISVDIYNNVYIIGYSDSNGLATTGAYQTSASPNSDGVIAKFDSSGKRLWATYYGGTNGTYAGAIVTDKIGNVYITGLTYSDSGVATSGAYQTFGDSINGDAFITKFNTNGALLWGSYYGDNDYGIGITTDNSGNIYLAGQTFDTSKININGVYQDSNAGGLDGFLAKFNVPITNDAGIAYILSPIGNFCADSLPIKVQLKNFGSDTLKSVKIRYSINNKIQTTYNWTGSLVHDSTTIVLLGSHNFTLGIDTIKAWTFLPNGVTDSLPGNDTAWAIIAVNPLPKANTGNSKLICYSDSALIGDTAIVGDSYSWVSNPVGFTSTIATAWIAPVITTTYTLTETIKATACAKSNTVIATVSPLPNIPIIKLSGDTLTSSAGLGNQWFRDDTLIKGATSQKYLANVSGNYSVTITDSNGCSATSAPVNYTTTSIKSEANVIQLRIYPNPSFNTFTIQVQNLVSGETEICLSDIFGQQVTTFSIKDKNEFIINAADYGMKGGVYILSIYSGNNLYTAKLMVK